MGLLNRIECGNNGMHVLSFCSHPCPLGKGESKDPINGIVDVLNEHHGHFVLNMDCGIKFSEFHTNHVKIGTCNSNNLVIASVNNHSTESQGPRGGFI